MDNEDDEIDDLEDIRKIMEQTQKGNSNQNFNSNIVPYEQDFDAGYSILNRTAVDTTFRQPNFSSNRPVPHYLPQHGSSPSSSIEHKIGEQQSSLSQQPNTKLNLPISSVPLPNNEPGSTYQPLSRPMTFSSGHSLKTSNPPNPIHKPNLFTPNPIAPLQPSKSDQLPGVPVVTSTGFSKKDGGSSVSFSVLARNSNGKSFYDRQPTLDRQQPLIFGSTLSANQNAEYRYRDANLQQSSSFRPNTTSGYEKPNERAQMSSTIITENETSQTSGPVQNVLDKSKNTTDNTYDDTRRPSSTGFDKSEELNPSLRSLREDPQVSARPLSRRPDSRSSHSRQFSNEIRRSSHSTDNKNYKNSNHASSSEHHSSRPASRHNNHNRNRSNDDFIPSSDDRHSPTPGSSFRPRSRSPLNNNTFKASNLGLALDPRPIGLQVCVPSNSTGPTTKMDKTGKIPKKATSKPKDDLSSMGLMELLNRKNEIKRKLENLAENKKNLERKRNDIERNSRGKNVENDPQHINLREQIVRIDTSEREFKTRLDSIWDRLESQFDYKKSSVPVSSSSGKFDSSKKTKKSRPKMSTTPSGPNVDVTDRYEREKHLMKSQLNLEDSHNWCQPCDLHLKTLKEYYLHLHSENHSERTKYKARPWHRENTEFLTKQETLTVIDKIVDQEAKRSENNLSTDDFKEIFDPSKYQSSNKKQDNSKSDEQPQDVSSETLKSFIDTIKGQRFLVPVTGAYCTLCQKGLLDENEVEQHMRSYEHISSHTRMVFIDPSIESNYQRDMNKSLEKMNAIKDSSEREKKEARLNDLVAAKLAKDNKKRTNNRCEDDVPMRAAEKNRLIALGKSRVGSSKRFNRDDSTSSTSDSPKKRRVVDDKHQREMSAISERNLAKELELSDDEPEELEHSIMPMNDPESLFAHLELAVHGHTHVKQLKDKKLITKCFVVMEKLDYNDPKYKLMKTNENALSRLNPKASLFNSIIKSEPFDWTLASPTYFDNAGDQIPITLNSDSEEDESSKQTKIKNEKPDKPSKSLGNTDKKQNETSPIERNSPRKSFADKTIKEERSSPKKSNKPPEVIKLFSDDEDDGMDNNDLNSLISTNNSPRENSRLPTFTLTSSSGNKSMEFTSTIPEKNPNGTLNSIAINNDSSNDNLGGITFESKNEGVSPTARSSSPPLDNIIISDHSSASNLIHPSSLGDHSIEDSAINNQISAAVNPVTNNITTTRVSESLCNYMVSTSSTSHTTTSFPSTTSSDIMGMPSLSHNPSTKMENMLCGTSLNFDHHDHSMGGSLDVDDVDLGSNFQTPNLSDLSDPLVNTFNSDPHMNSL